MRREVNLGASFGGGMSFRISFSNLAIFIRIDDVSEYHVSAKQPVAKPATSNQTIAVAIPRE